MTADIKTDPTPMAELSLSVIIPTYGRSDDLKGLILSVDPG